MFVSTRTPNVFFLGERESCACFRHNIPFFDLQVILYGQMTSIINSICFKYFVVDSLSLMSRYFVNKFRHFG